MSFKSKAMAAAAALVMCVSVGAVSSAAIGERIVAGAFQSAQETRSISDIQSDWIGNIFYTGEAIEPELTLHDYSKGYVLVKGVDYSVSFSDNVNAGRAKAVITGLGIYQGEKTIEFDIGKRPFYTDTQLTLDKTEFAFTGSEIKPAVKVVSGGRTLVQGTDYTVSYQDNVNIGTGRVTVNGIGNCEGNLQTTFSITQGNITASNLTLAKTSYAFTGAAVKPAVTVKFGSKTLVKDTDYSVAYSSNTKAGTGKVTVTGKGSYKGTASKTFTITKKSLSSLKPTAAAASYAYTGKAITPDVTLKNGSTALKKGTDYTLTYKANKAIGTATITVTGKGNYTGTAKCTFKIVPKKVTGVKVKATSKTAAKLTWTKTGNAKGYRLYVYNTSTKKYDKITTLSSNATVSYSLKGLKAGKTYKYKVRAYKKVNGVVYWGTPSAAVTLKLAESGTPVANHGRLKVSGANIVDSKGKKFQMIGMSTHGLMWEDFSNITTKSSLKVLRDDWGVNTIRLAMYTEEYGGYTTGSGFAAQAKQKVITGVKNATDLGMYVIIDWHILKDGNPQTHQKEAVAFFTEMAKKYKGYNNVIYEICNEPNGGVTWARNIKPYCQAVVNAIRKYDKNAIIVCGTGTWSQDIDQVLGNKINDKNCVYTLHFYANTHTDWLRNRVTSCYSKGLPILVTEFDTCDASGNGGFNAAQTKTWLSLLDKYMIGYLNWSACGKAETASAFKSGTNLSAIKKGTSQLTESGKLIRSLYRKRTGK
ncbi:MAG: cellulase family glycosylhydrolase [Ruminococcus sp.]|nr:cellulase family glycosylhydrolase [Ruminococcus sp.]